jgi:hypothetical protein
VYILRVISYLEGMKMNRREWLKLARIINGSTIYGKTNEINKSSLVEAIRQMLTVTSHDIDYEIFYSACYGNYNKELI